MSFTSLQSKNCFSGLHFFFKSNQIYFFYCLIECVCVVGVQDWVAMTGTCLAESLLEPAWFRMAATGNQTTRKTTKLKSGVAAETDF